MTEPEKKFKVLYVCPLAHWAGHRPQALAQETCALLKAGVEVSIFTFWNILGQKEPHAIPHKSVVSSWIGFPLRVLRYLENITSMARGLAWFLEQLTTICLAVKQRKALRYDVIYLRDGDPFIFIPFVLGLFLKNYKWVIYLIGIRQSRYPGSWFYRFISAPFWKPIYRRSLSRNQYAFICENIYLKDHFETVFLDGILSGKVTLIPLSVERPAEHIRRREARRYLGLPEDASIFLHLGAVHPGKDMETVLAAISEIPSVRLVQAGKATPGINLNKLVNQYDLQDRVLVRDYYISEAEKQYYFAAADAVILSYQIDFYQTASMFWEAAKFRVPVIASDIGELGELTRQYQVGLVFNAGNTASLKMALLNFLSSSQRGRETMASNYEGVYNDFSPDNWADRCLKLLSELCQQDSNEC